MSKKSKGTNAERDLIHKFWSKGCAAIRSAGSGSMKYPSPDILVSKNGNTAAIECKITKNNYKYFEKDEIHNLRYFSTIFNAHPYIAIKFNKNDWFFFELNDLKEKDKSFMVDLDLTKVKGKSFDEFVSFSK